MKNPKFKPLKPVAVEAIDAVDAVASTRGKSRLHVFAPETTRPYGLQWEFSPVMFTHNGLVSVTHCLCHCNLKTVTVIQVALRKFWKPGSWCGESRGTPLERMTEYVAKTFRGVQIEKVLFRRGRAFPRFLP